MVPCFGFKLLFPFQLELIRFMTLVLGSLPNCPMYIGYKYGCELLTRSSITLPAE